MHFGSYGRLDDGPGVFDRLYAAVQIAEASGFDVLSVPDHLQQNRVGGGPDSPMFEAYTLLGALAMHTSSARLLALVSPVTLRHPALLAKCTTTLDVLSRGRAMLGVGAGWDVAEHEAYGLPFPGTGERMGRLDDALAVCRAMFSEQRATVSGTYYSVNDAPNSPRPAGPIPILVGGGGERRTLDIAARYADACNVFGDAETARHKFDVLERHCERAGRDPAEITKTVFAPSPDDLAEFADRAGALAAVGAEGMIVIGPEDPDRIPAIGRILAEAFPD
jgi:F420-dependent oxidoreductase-like protein